MPITSNRSTDMVRRQAFNGKGLTFIEVIFDDDITNSATTPESKDSVFDLVTKVVNRNGTLLASSYRLAAKATDNDAAEAAAIASSAAAAAFFVASLLWNAVDFPPCSGAIPKC